MGKLNGDRRVNLAENQPATFKATAVVREEKDAVEQKLKRLAGNFFGRPIVRFAVVGTQKVWIPYAYMVFEYYLKRKLIVEHKAFDKAGKIAFVFDLNEVHPFQYDLGDGELKLVKKREVDFDGIRIEVKADDQELIETSEFYMQTRILKRFFGAAGETKLIKKELFYRPAIELQINYSKDVVNFRYAYLDEFSIAHEHVLGLKYRMGTN